MANGITGEQVKAELERLESEAKRAALIKQARQGKFGPEGWWRLMGPFALIIILIADHGWRFIIGEPGIWIVAVTMGLGFLETRRRSQLNAIIDLIELDKSTAGKNSSQPPIVNQ